MNEDALRKLEQAHSDLECAIALSEIEEEGSILSTLSQSAATGPSCSKSEGFPMEISDIDEIMRKIGELEREPDTDPGNDPGLSEIEEEDSMLLTLSQSAATHPSSSKSEGSPKGISDIDEIMKKIGELEHDTDPGNASHLSENEEDAVLLALSQSDKTGPFSSKSEGIPKGINDIDEIMRKIRELEPDTDPGHALGLSKNEDEDETHRAKEFALLDEVARLRAENSTLTLKLKSRLPPKQDSSIQIKQKAELGKLRTELNAKSEQVGQLHREISNLQQEGEASRAKECEFVDQISRLKTEIATIKLNNLLPPKTESSVQIKHKAELDKLRTELNAKSLEVIQLQRQISDLKQDCRTKECELLEQVCRLKTEIAALKSNKIRPPEPDASVQAKHKAELEKLRTDLNVKSQQVVQFRREISNLKQAAHRPKTAAAPEPIKQNESFMCQEKENEYQKTIRALQEQVRITQSELTSFKNGKGMLDFRIRELSQELALAKDLSKPTIKECELLDQVCRLKKEIATLKRNKIRPVKPDTSVQVKHKAELEKLRTDLNVKSQQVVQFRREISNLKQAAHRPKAAAAPEPIKQNESSMCQEKENEYQKTIRALQEQVRITQSELNVFKNGKGMLEFRIRELSQELAMAKNLIRPENEILTELAEKVDSLNSRYNYREKQLDVLLKIASKSGSYSNSLVNSIVLGSAEEDMGSLSPTTTLHLLIDNNDN